MSDTPEQLLADAARRLADKDHDDLRRALAIFIDHWGLDAYTPPEAVEKTVRDIVKGFVTVAQIMASERQSS